MGSNQKKTSAVFKASNLHRFLACLYRWRVTFFVVLDVLPQGSSLHQTKWNRRQKPASLGKVSWNNTDHLRKHAYFLCFTYYTESCPPIFWGGKRCGGEEWGGAERRGEKRQGFEIKTTHFAFLNLISRLTYFLFNANYSTS